MENKWRRVVCLCYFFIMVGVVMGNWVARIPDVKKAHSLSDGMFGLILVCGVGGGLLSFPIISPLCKRYGSSKGLLIGGISISLLTPWIGFPYYEIWILALGIAGLGFGWGILDVTSNSQASLYEKSTGEHKMGFFTAFFSLGGFCGSLIGGLFASLNISPFVNLLIVSAITGPLSFVFYLGLCHKQEEEDIILNDSTTRESYITNTEYNNLNSSQDLEQRRKFLSGDISEISSSEITSSSEHSSSNKLSFLSSPLVPMCGIVLVVTLGEGAMGDWTTIFLTDSLDMSSFDAALGYAIFCIMVGLGRYFSDHIRSMLEPSRAIRLSGLIASFGLGLLSLSPSISNKQSVRMFTSYLGLFITGCGISFAYPVLLTIASRLPNIDPTEAILTVTGFAYIGVLIGPPLFGWLSYLYGGLMWSLLTGAFLLLLIAFFGLFLHKNDSLSSTRESCRDSENNITESLITNEERVGLPVVKVK